MSGKRSIWRALRPLLAAAANWWQATADRLSGAARRRAREQPLPLGRRGELEAARYLRKQRMKIVEQGVQSRFGEIDLVAVDGQTVVFVEVKTRRDHRAGHPIEAVDRDKQRQLTRLALAYLKRHGLLEQPARFDVVGVTWSDDASRPTIRHVRNAFPAVGQGSLYS